MSKLKELVEKHPMTFIVSTIIVTVGLTFKITTYWDKSNYETTINKYESVISTIERRLGGKESIDVSKLISKSINNQTNENLKFFPKDNFYATKDKYWTYKYSSPIELNYIKNGENPPPEIKDNPIDLPIHIWIGGKKYLVTESEVNPYNTEQPIEGLNLSPDNKNFFYSLNQHVFQTIIVLQKWDKSNNSMKMRLKENLDSVAYSINFNEFPEAELMGRFLRTEIDHFYKSMPVGYVNKEILSVQKTNEILYSQFLTTYQDIEIDKLKRNKFYVYTEFIIINSNNDLYTLKIETPSLEPRKIGESFQKITEWYAAFGIVGN
jgi:hypothetical protein